MRNRHSAAEPFKQWLAQVGYERMQEIENPELATQRARELYKAKGYPEDWIERRMRSIAIRTRQITCRRKKRRRLIDYSSKNISINIRRFVHVIIVPKIVILLILLLEGSSGIIQFIVRNIEIAS